MSVGGCYHYVRIYPWLADISFECWAVDRSIMFIARLMTLTTHSFNVANKNNDEFYCRKSMQADNKKLIINESGPNCSVTTGFNP